MSAQLIKTKTAGRFVEVNIKIDKEKFPQVSEALAAVLALAGHRFNPEKHRAAKTARTGPAHPGKGRWAAVEKKTASPETAALIRDLRVKAGLSQKTLAAKSGASQNQISLLETGKQGLKPALAKKLSRLFKTPVPAEN